MNILENYIYNLYFYVDNKVLISNIIIISELIKFNKVY